MYGVARYRDASSTLTMYVKPKSTGAPVEVSRRIVRVCFGRLAASDVVGVLARGVDSAIEATPPRSVADSPVKEGWYEAGTVVEPSPECLRAVSRNPKPAMACGVAPATNRTMREAGAPSRLASAETLKTEGSR